MANQNPATMTDEELEQALAEVGVTEPEAPEVEEPENPTPPEEEEAEAEEVEEEEPEEEEEQPEEEGAKPPSRREQLRIQDLLRKYPEKAPAPAKPAAAPEGTLDINKDVEADDELKQRLIADRQAAADNAYKQGLEQAKASITFHTRLEVDAPRIEAKYPQLDKTNDKFKPVLANAINTMYLSAVGYDKDSDTVQNPNIRYSDYVESIFELASEVAGEQTVEAKKNIVKQAAKTGLRPDGSTPKRLNLNKLPSQMTDEELDAVIAQAIPSK